MITSDFATLVSLASEANQAKPSRRLLDELANSVSEEAKEVAEAISQGSKVSLNEDQKKYFDAIVELAAET